MTALIASDHINYTKMAEIAKNLTREFSFPLMSEVSERDNVNNPESDSMIIVDIPAKFDKGVPSEQRRMVVTDLNSKYNSIAMAKGGDMITVEKISKGGIYKTWDPSQSKWVANIHDNEEPRYLFKGIISKSGQELWFSTQFGGVLDSMMGSLGSVAKQVTETEAPDEAEQIASKAPEVAKTRKPRAKKAA